MTTKDFEYQHGFGNTFSSEALPGALPVKLNSPQVCPYGLYAEQLSGTAFTVPRAVNQRSWLYRIYPAAKQGPFKKIDPKLFTNAFTVAEPQDMRWQPFDIPSEPLDFVEGLISMAGAGDVGTKAGMAIHEYVCNKDMTDKAFYNSDGDFLIVPQQGALRIKTEFGWMLVSPGEICVIQRGIRFAVFLPDGPSRGYICETYCGHFKLPDLGPIGGNGLANPRDFLTPVAAFEDVTTSFQLVNKFLGELFVAQLDHSVFDVVAWYGNYAPYKYNLDNFSPVGSVAFDHPDPSIFTVLTSPTLEPGVAACDFVIFPPRWAVAEGTFRPPYYHRNCMSEFMGLIRGKYEAKEKGFVPGGASLHPCMSPHGPDRDVFENTVKAELKPVKIQVNDMAFMFETSFLVKLTSYAHTTPKVESDYYECWAPLQKHFDPSWKPESSQ